MIRLGFRRFRAGRRVGPAHALRGAQIRGPGGVERGGEGVQLRGALLVIRLVGWRKLLITQMIRAGALDEFGGGRSSGPELQTLGGVADRAAQRLRVSWRNGAKEREREPQDGTEGSDRDISP